MGNSFLNRFVVVVLAVTCPLTLGIAQELPETMTPSECERMMALHIDKQANPHAARIVAACSGGQWSYAPATVPLAGPAVGGSTKLLGTSDLNLITGDETFPAVTQAGSMVWGDGTDIVAVYTDTKDAPTSYSGMSVSTNGGITFDRLAPDPFGSVFGGDFGSPAVVYDVSGGSWLAAALTSTCGAQGIGLMSSADPSDPAAWLSEPCAHSGAADDRPILWVDNNPGSSFYGRIYISFNDFSAGGALKVLYYSAATWTEVTVDAGFIRNVHITGSSEADGTVFIFGMDEGGGAGNGRINWVYRSTDGGVSWTSVSPGPSYPAAGAGLCSASDYFYMIPPVWRHMGWGQGAVGPGGVVHYVFCRRGQVPGDLGDIYYIRSPDNGTSWSSPVPLNTDQALTNNVVQWLPSISVTSQGYVLATWYDRRNTTDGLNYEYYGRLSLDNGATFLPDEPISDVAIPQPTQVDPNTDFCFAGDSNFHGVLSNDSLVTWTDGRNAISEQQQMDVYFDRVPLCPSVDLSPTTLPNGQLTQAYDQTLSGSGGAGPYTFVLAGALPPPLVLDGGTGSITGTPTSAGIYPFSVVATDSLGCSGSQDYSLIIDPTGCPSITLTPTILPDGAQGAPYAETVEAGGGAGPYTYALTAGALPDGMTLNTVSGEISGAPMESGAYGFNITATDSNQCTGSQSYTLTITCPVITLSPEENLPDAVAGIPYLTNITANGGTAPYKFEIIGGTQHKGVFLGEGGTVFGMTEAGGNKNITVQAIDVNGCQGEKGFGLRSKNCFAGAILCDDKVDLAALIPNFTAADQCNGDAEWHNPAGGVCLSSDDIGHTPSAHARWGTALDCNDYGAGATEDHLDSYSMDVSNCNSGEVILHFNYLLSFEDDNTSDRARVEVIADGGAPEVVADNGAGGPTCSVGAGSPGIKNLKMWSGWQHLELTIPATSTFEVSFIAETDDGINNAGEGFFIDDVKVWCKCPDDYFVTPDVLPPAIRDAAYSVTFEASGGAPPYDYDTVQGGNPPPTGLTLDPVTGVMSGIPTTAGIFPFVLEVNDSNFCLVRMPLNLIVSPPGCPAITFTPDTLPDEVEGTFYSQVVAASGGTEPYSYSVTAGGLPAGLSLDPLSGLIGGTPDTPGIYQFTISIIDFIFCIGSHDYSVIISPAGCPLIEVSPTVLPNAENGEPYSEFLTATGGVAPYIWALSAGELPAGLTLDQATGEISGTPDANDVFAFAVTAEDDEGCFGTQAYGIEVADFPPRVMLVHTVSDTGNGQLETLERTLASITQLYITFSEEVFNPAGNTGPDDVTNPDNYLLVNAGANDAFATTSCAAGIAGDDQAVTVDQVAFDLPSTTARLSFIGGDHLFQGKHRLLVCGSTSIVDLTGQPLDGNGDGTSGDDFVLDFTVKVDNLLVNPNFDDDLWGWTTSSPGETNHGTDDAGAAPTSGSAAITNLTGAGHIMSLTQCVPVTRAQTYVASGKVRMDSGAPTTGAKVVFYSGASCGGSALATTSIPAVSGVPYGVFCDGFESGDTSAWGLAGGVAGCGGTGDWEQFSGMVVAPFGAVSAEVSFVLDAGASPDFTANLDDLQFYQELFRDGFESGDTSAWSVTVGN